MKKEWLPYIPVAIYVVAWVWIFSASAQAGCNDNQGLLQVRGGLCMARSIAGLSCFAVYFAVWTFLGVQVAKAKGRNPTLGAVLGFLLQFVGCLFMLTWEPRRDVSGRMIGWDEYKHMSEEQRRMTRTAPAGPPVRIGTTRKVLVATVIVIVVIVFVVQILKNLGKL
jgi:hypothetical protein